MIESITQCIDFHEEEIRKLAQPKFVKPARQGFIDVDC